MPERAEVKCTHGQPMTGRCYQCGRWAKDCPITSLEANVDPPDRTPDSYRWALDNCPHGCKTSRDCEGNRAYA